MPKLRFTLKAWPVIAIATIGLCFLTQLIAGWFGITLNEQTNVTIVRKMFARAFESPKLFGICALNVVLILSILPCLEELAFRGLLFKLPVWLTKHHFHRAPYFFAAVASVLFSAAHYFQQPFPDNAFVALAFFGVVQCWLYQKTNSIWCAMLNHSLFNLTNLVLLFIVPAP